MKKIILSLIAVTALCLSTQAQTPTYGNQLLLNFTNQPSAFTNMSAVIDCRKQASVSLIWIGGGQTGTSTATNNIFVQWSNDGTTWSTLPNDATPNGQVGKRITLTLAGGVVPTVLQTNIPTQGAGFMKIYGPTNSDATVVTTNLLYYAIKISSP